MILDLDAVARDKNLLSSLSTKEEIKTANALNEWVLVSQVWKNPRPQPVNMLHIFVKLPRTVRSQAADREFLWLDLSTLAISDLSAEEGSTCEIVERLMKLNMMQTLDFEKVTNASASDIREGSNFKDSLKEAYGFSPSDKRGDLWDMATGEHLRHGCVIAAHIFQYRWRKFLPILSSFKDIHDVQNGLLLYKPVEWAFDRAKIFIEVNDADKMTFRLLDQSLRNVKLADKASELRKEAKIERSPVGAEVTLQKTFGDLDGKDVQFPPNSEKRPSRRLLALHAYAAWLAYTSFNPDSEAAAPIYNISEDEATKHTLNHIISEWRKTFTESLK
jgi:hypothetical protein